ncbi:hypothetical protein ACJMK2_024034 [Sinanodonta woodiana]|uniref:Granulins domain-containing protein n=1 Tax=Sinanodonta woodiana TaxID=1069815 RepID=A0ABD3T649_SINWO
MQMLVLLVVCVLANTLFVKAEQPQELPEPQEPQEGLEMQLDDSGIEAVEPQGALNTIQASTTMAKSSNVGLVCPDPNYRCFGTQPCCSSSGGWRCCPYYGGTCCAGGWRCCPMGQICICGLWCH